LDGNLNLEAYLGPLIALVFTSGLILWLAPLAKAVGLVDIPDVRKAHNGEIPLIGGLCIFIAVFAAMTISGLARADRVVSEAFGAFYLSGMLLVLAGTIDDVIDLSPLKKIAVQAFAAMIMIFGAGVVLIDLGMLGKNGEVLALGILAVPFTIFATIGVINALNMSDGLDGLAGSLSMVSLVGFMAATAMFSNGADLGLLAILAAAVGGFLLFNFEYPGRPSAVVFLGDSGSMFLGLALAWFAIKFSQGENRILAPSAALWFLLLPLCDAVAITTRRILRRKPPFGADREHLHHIFLLAGFTVTETVLIMASIAILGVIVGLAGTYFNVPESVLLGTFLVVGLMYLWMIVHSWSVMRFLRRSINRRTVMADRRVDGDRRRSTKVAYMGPERRCGLDRRQDPRRVDDGRTRKNSRDSEDHQVANTR
jgi:UDP-GlcNAc:undecaprenyl-phosphate GlcNAc-1-phosphate transferase